jgi:hypothetical protein
MNRDKSTPFARLLPPMLNWCHHLPGATGHFYALKGVRPDDEIAALPAGFFLAGCCAKPNGMNRDKSTPFARLLPPDHHQMTLTFQFPLHRWKTC